MFKLYLAAVSFLLIGSSGAVLADAKRDCASLSGDAAIKACDQAISQNPRDAAAYGFRGNEYYAKGDLERALADFDKLIEIDLKEAHAYNNRCWLRATADRDLALALLDCDDAVRLAPNNLVNRTTRGFVYLKLDRLDEAIADFDATLKPDPRMAASLYGRGIARQKKGDQAGGNADIAAAKAIKPAIADEFAKYGVN